MSKPDKGRPSRIRFVVLSLLLVGAVLLVWRCYFTQPAETKRLLYQGVTYERRVQRKPRPVTIHLLKIDTRTPGLRFLVTPPDKPGDAKPLIARMTSEFLREHHLQAAINGDFFYPWKSNGVLDYYPHHHDLVTVNSDAVSDGVRYVTRNAKSLETLYLSKENHASFSLPKGEKPWNAIGGRRLLRNNVSHAHSDYDKTVPDPRTAVGLSPDHNILYLVCVDGRQTGYSDGMTILELAEFFRSLGVRDAINLDGGGSTALVIGNGKNGSQVLNRPIDKRFPGHERYVANHLGIYAAPLP